MKTILFRHRFQRPILNGTKTQTIRRPRKRPLKAGEVVSLREWQTLPYRSPQIEIGTARIYQISHVVLDLVREEMRVELDGVNLGELGQLESFAIADGFRDVRDMARHWAVHKGFPFVGVCYHWTDFAAKSRARKEAHL
jgi:uncharacterized protein YqfB (UPF0267 family)